MAQKLAKDLDSILALPLTAVQGTLSRGLLSGTFSTADRDAAIAAIRKLASHSQRVLLDAEERNIQAALADGKAPTDPNLSTPELQMLWAAYLNVVACQPGAALTQLPLWRQLTKCDDVVHQRNRHAMAMARDQFNTTTKLKWGEPGSMFYFDPQANSINIDLLMSMCCGFENTRSIMFHEMGHSKLTVKLTDALQSIYDEMVALQTKGQKGEIEPDEYVRLKTLQAEWKFRHRVFDEAENSPVNRYTIDRTARVTPDPEDALDRALNIVETTLAEAAEQPPVPSDPTPLDKFRNFTRIVRMGLYKNNGLFEDTPAGWARIGVHPEWVEALPRNPGDPAPTWQEAFADLLKLCGGPEGLENLQPGTLDRMQGAAWLAAKTDEYANRRNRIIDEHLWARYAEPLVRQYIEQVEQQTQKNVEQAQQQQDQSQQSQSGQGQSGQGQSGQSSSGQGQQSDQQGQGESGQGQSGESQSGQGQSGQSSSGQGQQGNEQGQDKSGQGSGAQDGDGKQGQKQSGQGGDAQDDGAEQQGEEKSSKGGEAQGENGEAQGQEQSGQGGDAASEDSAPPGKDPIEDLDAGQEAIRGKQPKAKPVNVKGAGSMPGVPMPDHPKKSKGAESEKDATEDKDGNEKGDGEGQGEGEGQSEGEGESIESILEQMDNAEKATGEGQGEGEGEGEGQDASDSKSGSRGKGGESSKKSIPKVGEMSDYQRVKAESSGSIHRAHQLLRGIRDKQAKMTPKTTSKHELLPRDGNMRRFNMRRHTDLVTKMQMGETISVQDASRFRIEEQSISQAEIDAVLLIDGSASMYGNYSGRGGAAPIDAGVHTGCILNEAARKLNAETKRTSREQAINVWTVVWGNNPPLFITTPESDDKEVAQAISGLYNSQGWGTSLAPALRHTVQAQAERKGKTDKQVGFTHFFVISDGDIGDTHQTIETLDKLLTHAPNITFDVIVINPWAETQMGNAIKEVQARHGEQRVKLVPCERAEECDAAVLALLRERMIATTRSKSIPFAERTRQLQKAHQTMIM